MTDHDIFLNAKNAIKKQIEDRIYNPIMAHHIRGNGFVWNPTEYRMILHNTDRSAISGGTVYKNVYFAMHNKIYTSYSPEIIHCNFRSCDIDCFILSTDHSVHVIAEFIKSMGYFLPERNAACRWDSITSEQNLCMVGRYLDGSISENNGYPSSSKVLDLLGRFQLIEYAHDEYAPTFQQKCDPLFVSKSSVDKKYIYQMDKIVLDFDFIHTLMWYNYTTHELTIHPLAIDAIQRKMLIPNPQTTKEFSHERIIKAMSIGLMVDISDTLTCRMFKSAFGKNWYKMFEDPAIFTMKNNNGIFELDRRYLTSIPMKKAIQFKIDEIIGEK